MNKNDLFFVGLIFTIALLVSSNSFSGKTFHFIATPITKQVSVSFQNNIYGKEVVWISYKPHRLCGGDLYPNVFKVDVKTEYLQNKFCYLKIEKVESQPCIGRTNAWEIKNVTLIAPLTNGVCDFYKYGKILNPETAYYEYYSNGMPPYKANCKQFPKCLELIKMDSTGVKGLLYFKIQKNSIMNCSALSGSYCSNDNVEVRKYYCEKGYGTNQQCFIGHCKHETISITPCEAYQICSNGKCVMNPLFEIVIFLLLVCIIILSIAWSRK